MSALAAAVALWAWPAAVGRHVPVSAFGGRVLGGWLLLAAVAAVWTALRPHRRGTTVLVVGLPFALSLLALPAVVMGAGGPTGGRRPGRAPPPRRPTFAQVVG